MAPSAYVAEDGLVGHQGEERPLCPRGGDHQNRAAGVGGLVSRGREDGM